jgi:hypothetical protein
MNEPGVIKEQETFFRRLNESFHFAGREIDPQWWWAIIIPVLLLGLFFVGWMYVKDSRTIRWYWAVPLALLRCSVYGLLAYMFLLPSKQTWEKSEKRWRVLAVLDVSDSMHTSDDMPGTARPETRLRKVIDFLTDDNVAFLKKLLDKNPLYVYRLGTRLDDEPLALEKRISRSEGGGESADYLPLERVTQDPVTNTVKKDYGSALTADDWNAFVKYDFKPWLTRGLSAEGKGRLRADPSFEGNDPGNADWAKKWLEGTREKLDAWKARPQEVPTFAGLNYPDMEALIANVGKLEVRIDVARSIASGTNVPDSLLSLVNREAGNMVQGIIVFSDGRNTLGSESAITELRSRARRENIPILTVAVGEDRQEIKVRITGVQAPSQTPPDEPFKIAVEVDGEGMLGQEVPITLDLTPPGRETPYSVGGKVKFAPGEPPHGQAEFVIDPAKAPEDLRSKSTNFKDLIEGDWKVQARTPRPAGQRTADKEIKSPEVVTVKVIKKPLRVLLFASGPTRDFQFLLNQMLRDKADMSVLLQNEGGISGKIAMLDDAERLLNHFPTRLRVDEDAAATSAEKWYNLARYDVIIAFDPDWTALSAEQLQMLQTWVELQAGGIIFVAGPFHTKQLARTDEAGQFKPLLDIYPVVPGDIDIVTLTRDKKNPGRLTFPGVGPDTDYLRLDDDQPEDPLAGWELFFTGRDKSMEGLRILRGFYSYYPVQVVKPGATVVARFNSPQDARTPDGKDPPFIVTNKFGQGMTMFVASGEVWRLRQYKEIFFERFWTKLTRYVSTGSRRKQDQRGRILMNSEFPSGGYIRFQAQLLDPDLKPVLSKTEPKAVMEPIALDAYQTKDIEKENKKYRKQFTLSAKVGRQEEWQGYFNKQVLATPEAFPPGQWRLEVEIPSSSETLKQRFIIRPSNPEIDNTRPDLASLAAIAGELDEVAPRIADKSVVEQLRSALPKTPEGQKLAFKFDNQPLVELIPECMVSLPPKTLKNRGAVEDQWDKGPELPHWATDWWDEKKRTHHVGWALLLAVGLLSVEWLTRKLLRLA